MDSINLFTKLVTAKCLPNHMNPVQLPKNLEKKFFYAWFVLFIRATLAITYVLRLHCH